MGYRSSWIGFRDTEDARVLHGLGLASTGQEEDFLDEGLWLVRRGDWVLVCARHTDEDLDEELASAMSSEGVCIYACIDEASMTAALVSYGAEQEDWAVRYDGSDGVGDPVVEGDVPDEVSEVLESLRFRQRATEGDTDHLFSATTLISERHTGFRPDEAHAPTDGASYLRLQAAPTTEAVHSEAAWARATATDGIVELCAIAHSSNDLTLTLLAAEDIQLVRVLQVDYADELPRGLHDLTTSEPLGADVPRTFSLVSPGDAVRLLVDYRIDGERRRTGLELFTG